MCSVSALIKANQLAQLQKLCSISAYIQQHNLHDYNPRSFECNDVRGAVFIQDRAVLREKLQMLKRGGSRNASVLTDFDQTLTRLKLPDGSSADSVFKTVIKYKRTPKSV